MEVYQLYDLRQMGPGRLYWMENCWVAWKTIMAPGGQLSGEQMSGALFEGITSHINSQYFNSLPQAICSRWPNLVEKVVLKSDTAYMVICKAGISFKDFERIFLRFVPYLFKEEWTINFQVFNHDFSDDFSLDARPLVYKKETFGWEKMNR